MNHIDRERTSGRHQWVTQNPIMRQETAQDLAELNHVQVDKVELQQG